MWIKVAITAFIFSSVHCGPTARRQALNGDSCPLFCAEDLWMPICGSDGRTYGNRCEFNLAHCKNHDLTIAFFGTCPTIVRARGIVCTTPWCFPIDEPVCGSDGLTYRNQCELYNAKCENESLKLDYRGPCHPSPPVRRSRRTMNTVRNVVKRLLE